MEFVAMQMPVELIYVLVCDLLFGQVPSYTQSIYLVVSVSSKQTCLPATGIAKCKNMDLSK